jgi:hypothetical protein
MATTTPNYAWVVPTSSDLVKNGATAIETLGDSVDASLWNSGYGQAGKNKVINADFGIWQRGTTFTNPAGDSYTADRFMIDYGTAAPTSNSVTRQTFTPGTAPVAGYEGSYFFRSTLTTVGTTSRLSIHHKIEDVRTYAAQTVTLSFWAKADSARTLAGFVQQNFGSGGSATVSTAITSQSITTAWTRFSMQVAVPSISGKTIGTSSFLNIRLDQAVAAGSVLELWGIQLEYGSTATPFQTATGTLQGELAACQRYYYRIDNETSNGYFGLSGAASTATLATIQVLPKSTMRIKPTSVDFSSLRTYDLVNAAQTISAITISNGSGNGWSIDVTSSSMSQYRGYVLLANTLPSYLGFSAEL